MAIDYLGVLAGAVALKLLSSADDVIWLARLFEGMKGLRLVTLVIVYIATLLLVCVLSFLLAWIGSNSFLLLTGNEAWFSLVGSVLLILFAVTVLRKEEEEDFHASENDFLFTRLRDAFVISFIGSLDELAVYTVALSTGEIRFSALLLGTVIGGILTLMVVFGIRSIQVFVEWLEKLPVWIIICLLGWIGLIYSGWELVA